MSVRAVPSHVPSRRALLKTAGAASGALAALPLTAGSAQAAPAPKAAGAAATGRFRTRVVLLGTAGGRTWWTGSERQGISSALVVQDAVYLVDFGDGWGRRYLQAGLGGPDGSLGLARLEAAFLTHLHSDHIADLSGLFTFGSTDGLTARHRPVQVFGPGSRGSLPPLAGSPTAEPPVINPQDPVPGTAATTEYLYQAFANDLNDNIRDSLKPDPHTLVRTTDITLPDGLVTDPDHDSAPRMAPVHVFGDDRVRVTATLVNHPPVFPAFAFRFDTDDGSVVFSGDTSPCDNLVRLAEGADMLVHEVIDKEWVTNKFPAPPSPEQQAKMDHLLRSHTTIEDVGRVAEQAGVKTLVLNHLAPADNPQHRWLRAQRGFAGRLIVGEDLDHIGVGSPAP
ncbi:MBL fold metallo-hydrolase [Streptomyces sp. NPDC056690]|uniref:MBL fold metallo-hydrolase n=3 Tax=Streptomyces TaxID=1883 RepID=UPI00363AB64D